MDSLVLELEQLLQGANASLDMAKGDPPPFDWLAAKLRGIYANHSSRLPGVSVRVLPDRGVEVDRLPDGVPRVLVVSAVGRSWEIAGSVNASTPGTIAPILAAP